MQKFKAILNRKGFTLIEVIIALALVGVGTVVAGMGIVWISSGYNFTKENAATALKGQVTLTRLVKEFSAISAVNAASANSITYVMYKDGATVTSTVAWAGSTGDPLLLNGDILTDDVTGFVLAYYDTYDGASQSSWSSSRKLISVTLTLEGAENVASAFTIRVAPRNI
jgi:prepilin-type N-terminal cleavage/methylation domain-containing protein